MDWSDIEQETQEATGEEKPPLEVDETDSKKEKEPLPEETETEDTESVEGVEALEDIPEGESDKYGL